jgi:hypothetical protein
VCGGRGEFEACIKLSSAAIGFGLDGLLTFDFNEDNFLGAQWLELSINDVLLGGPSII